MRASRSSCLSVLAGLALLLAAVALAGVSGGTAAPAPRAAVDVTKACATPQGRSTRLSVAVDGQGTRSALLHVPPGAHHALALIVALHGTGGSGAFMEGYTGLSRLANRYHFAVVYPDAVGRSWRIGADEGDADVQFVDELLDRLLAGGCFDPRRVSATGVSNGAGMAARFACAGDDRLAGIVAVAGAYGSLPACRAHRPLSVLEIHGTSDTTAPYYGKPGHPRISVARWLRRWADLDDCPDEPTRNRPRQGLLRLDWGPCRGRTAVAHLQIVGGRHAWPGANPPDPGPQHGVLASLEAWRFLGGRRLAPPGM
ncbi:MAG: polyhydroxybutyrate depolymerase [Solirubrobacteraceae bacterium]|jgi:polyhydroxybutyrate depolymerase|nr:polyhydroxybutyrate depolymerase [Solirubrobacteraceae bacterium]